MPPERKVIIREDPETGEAKVSHVGFANDFEALGWMQAHLDSHAIIAGLRDTIYNEIDAKVKAKEAKAKAETEKKE